MEWLARYAAFGWVNGQKLALVFVREVGAIDNATYRQLDSSITHARARLEIHKLCDLGFLEKKGQGRNTYYIRTSKVVSLGERLRPQGERLPAKEQRLPPQHGTLDQNIPPQGEMYHGKHGTFDEMYHGKHGTFGERYQGKLGTFDEPTPALNRDTLLEELPDGLKKKIEKVGKRILKEDLNQIIIALCSMRPYNIEELTLLLGRNPKSFKNFNIKNLLETKRLFYWIPEMIRHPQQKYVADPSMARSNTKKLDNKDK